MATPLLSNVSPADTSNFNDLRTGTTKMEGPNDKVYVLQGGRGKCYICQVDFTSEQSARQHLSGQKHTKKALAHQLSVNRPQVLTSAWDGPANAAVLPDSSILTSTANCQGNAIRPSVISNTSASSHTGVQVNPTFQPEPPRRGPNGEEYVLNGSRGTCFVCNVQFTSLEHAKSHLSGVKHRKKCASGLGSSDGGLPHNLGPGFMSNTTNGGVYMCSVCNVPFSCLANAEEHFMSDKHKKKVSMASLQGESVIRQDSSSSSFDHDHTDLKTMRDSPFMPIRNTSIDGSVSDSGFTGSGAASAGQSTPSPSVPLLQGKNQDQLRQPGPLKVIPCSKINSNLQHPSSESSAKEASSKGANTSKIEGITGGNNSSDISEIKKVKSKEVLSPFLPGRSDPTSIRSLDSVTDSIIDNSQQRCLKETNQSSTQGCIVGKNPVEEDVSGGRHLFDNQNNLRQNDILNNSFGIESNQSLRQTQVPASSSPKPVFYFDNHLHRGFCNACNVELTSTQLADQHLNGQKHKKNAAFWENGPLYPAIQPPQNSSTPVNDHPSCSVPQGPSPTVLPMSPVTLPETTERTTPVQDGPDETCFFNGIRGFCVACNIEISSIQHYNQHRLGKPHCRSRQRFLLSRQGIVYPLYCDICKKPFTGQESAQQHFTSARHKTKQEIVGEGSREVERLEDGRMVMRDSQIWYICDICDCPLNTREQFEIHKASPRHKKAFENKMNNSLPSQDQRPLDRNSISGSLAEPTKPAVSQSPLEYLRKERENVLEANLHHLTFKSNSTANSPLPPEGHPNEANSSEVNSWRLTQKIHRQGSSDTGLVGTATVSQPDFVQTPRSSLPTVRYGPGILAGTEMSVVLERPQAVGPGFQHNISSRTDDTRTGQSGSGDSAGHGDDAQSSAAAGNTNPSENTSIKQHTGRHSSNPCPDSVVERNHNSGVLRRPLNKRRTSNKSPGLAFRDLSTIEGRDSSDDDECFDCLEDEDQEVERTNFNISESEVDTLESNLDKLRISDPPQLNSGIERSAKHGFKYFCRFCNRHMNTKENMKAHIAGTLHQFNASTRKAPARSLSPVRPVIKENVTQRSIKLVRDTPRFYQMELLVKTMATRDTVIYLPTGTGKTMVAVLTMGLMLEENLTRPVLFLVDKVLLVLQQEKYIREQFQGKKFKRPDVSGDGAAVVERELLVKVICGGLFSKGHVPIWRNDIIVTTADFCMNMLEQGQIRWEDFSLVVLDEVHHCHKSHPYLRLFHKYHSPRQQQYPIPGNAMVQGQDRWLPKVLGLSASPASKESVEQTYNKLKDLLANLGGAQIVMVEDNFSELENYQSSATVRTECVPMSNNEADFTLHLLEYSLTCYVRLAHLCPMLKDYNNVPYSYFASAVRGTEEDITATAETLMQDMEPLMEITNRIFEVQCPAELQEEERTLFDHLKIHLTALLLLVSDVGTNSKAVTNCLLKELESSEKTKLFEKYSLPCQEMYSKVQHFAEHGSKDMTMFTKLIQTLSNPSYINWSDRTCKALVLTQMRQDAKQLASMLRQTDFVKGRDLQVSHLVGHGKGAQDGGMDVKKQKKVLSNQDRYHLLVATSIMEEGVDFQTLQLVVCMNPPTSVRALVQIRGRARRKGSHFVILCKLAQEEHKLKQLLKQEEIMEQAVRLCLRDQASGR